MRRKSPAPAVDASRRLHFLRLDFAALVVDDD
jgi:hypothetical protein